MTWQFSSFWSHYVCQRRSLLVGNLQRYQWESLSWGLGNHSFEDCHTPKGRGYILHLFTFRWKPHAESLNILFFPFALCIYFSAKAFSVCFKQAPGSCFCQTTALGAQGMEQSETDQMVPVYSSSTAGKWWGHHSCGPGKSKARRKD